MMGSPSYRESENDVNTIFVADNNIYPPISFHGICKFDAIKVLKMCY